MAIRPRVGPVAPAIVRLRPTNESEALEPAIRDHRAVPAVNARERSEPHVPRQAIRALVSSITAALLPAERLAEPEGATPRDVGADGANWVRLIPPDAPSSQRPMSG